MKMHRMVMSVTTLYKVSPQRVHLFQMETTPGMMKHIEEELGSMQGTGGGGVAAELLLMAKSAATCLSGSSIRTRNAAPNARHECGGSPLHSMPLIPLQSERSAAVGPVER